MNIINYEFKARVRNLEELEQKLKEINPVYKGEDHQVDTYFNVPKGRLKLREGQIENVKFHFDSVNELGTFIEVEASDNGGTIGLAKLKEQCNKYSSFFGLDQPDFINKPYSDLLLEIQAKKSQ
ncbi:MAG: hypothetical protein MUO72_06030 [Bacteroidales bacterium]|nr:hypothetical protein [Bacteroidales bacterium]